MKKGLSSNPAGGQFKKGGGRVAAGSHASTGGGGSKGKSGKGGGGGGGGGSPKKNMHDPAYRAHRVGFQASKVKEHAKAYRSATSAADKAKHKLAAEKAYKLAVRGEKATKKLDPGGVHHKKAMEHLAEAKKHYDSIHGSSSSSSSKKGGVFSDAIAHNDKVVSSWPSHGIKPSKNTPKEKKEKAPKKDMKSPMYRAHRAEHWAMKAEEAQKAHAAAEKAGKTTEAKKHALVAVAAYKKSLRNAKAVHKLEPGGNHSINSRNSAERAKLAVEKTGAKVKQDKFFKPKSNPVIKTTVNPNFHKEWDAKMKSQAASVNSPVPSHVLKAKGKEMGYAEFSSKRVSFTASLSSSEKSACLKYSGSSYKHINSALRKSKGENGALPGLDSALKKHKVDSDTLVYRGAGSNTKAIELFKSKKPGDTWTEHAYTSTATSGGFSGSLKYHITVPKGMRAAPIPSHHPGEKEMLLPRGTKFRVDHIETKKNGWGSEEVIVHATVVHQPY